MPASVSFSTCAQTSATSFGGRSRSTGGMDDGVVDEGHALLAVAVPAPGVVLVGIVEIGVGAERRQERRLVVGRAADPAIGDARPFGDRLAPGEQILERLRRLEEGVRLAAVAGVGRHHDALASARVVQRVVEAGDHAGGVAEGRMRRSRPSPARRRCRPRGRRAALRDIRRRSSGVAPAMLPIVSGRAAKASRSSRGTVASMVPSSAVPINGGATLTSPLREVESGARSGPLRAGVAAKPFAALAQQDRSRPPPPGRRPSTSSGRRSTSPQEGGYAWLSTRARAIVSSIV